MQLSQSLETLKTLHLYDIQIKSALQSRVVMCKHKVADYQRAYSNNTEFPPLLVSMELDDKNHPTYSLLDGWHRYNALMNNGAKLTERIKVRVVEVPKKTSVHALRFLGGRENLKNGLGLNAKDKVALFKCYVSGQFNKDGERYKSYREIGRDLSLVTHQTISNWMHKHFPSVASRMSKELGDEGQPSAQGSMSRITDMFDLSSREREIFFSDLLDVAKASPNVTRGEIIRGVKTLLECLEKEAPYEEATSIINVVTSEGDNF